MLSDHPGWLGGTSQGVLLIHADWPIYPEEHGWKYALMWLTMFLPGTAFISISDIDRCCLFRADVKCGNKPDPFDERNFHIAIWHEDIVELARLGFIDGARAVTERGWEEERRAAWPPGPYFYKKNDGTAVQFELPPLPEEDEDEDYSPRPSWPGYSAGGVRVSESGWKAALEVVSAVPFDIAAVLGERIASLFTHGFFDSAVREACIGLESRLRKHLQSEQFGNALIEEFIDSLRSKGQFIESFIRTSRGEFRAAFKFIRNDFMHNFVEINEAQCRAILVRLARVSDLIDIALRGPRT